MAQRPKNPESTHGERRRWEAYLFFVLLLLIPIAVIGAVFFPNLVQTTSAGWTILENGLILWSFGAVATFLLLLLYIGSPRADSEGKSWTMSHSETWDLGFHAPSSVPLALIQGQLSPQDQEAARKIETRSREGMKVHYEAHSIGGFNSLRWGFRSPAPFEGGIVITEGSGHWVMAGPHKHFLHPVVRADYAQFPTGVLNALEHGGEDGGPIHGFSRDKPMWTTRPTVSRWVEKYLTEHLEPQSIVLKHIGYENLKRDFWSDFDTELRARGLNPSVLRTNDPGSWRLITQKFEQWLEHKASIRLAMEQDWASAETNFALRLELQADNHRIKDKLEKADQEATKWRNIATARADKAAKVTGADRQPSEWSNANRAAGEGR